MRTLSPFSTCLSDPFVRHYAPKLHLLHKSGLDGIVDRMLIGDRGRDTVSSGEAQ
jgi:hypothetical protein